MRALSVVAGAALLAFAASPARADPVQCDVLADASLSGEVRARTLFNDASAREAADPEGALARYRCARELTDRPAIALRMGTVAERLGERDLAIAEFERYLTLAGRDAPDRDEMLRHVEGLRKAAAPPPKHPEPRLLPAPVATTPSALGPLSVAGAGLAIVGLGVGFLAVAASKDNDVHALPVGTSWSGNASDTYEAARRDQVVGIVALSVGLLTTGGGLVWLMSRRKSAEPALRVTAVRGGARVMLGGEF